MKIHLVEKNASIKDLFLGILLISAILIVTGFIPYLNILTGFFILPFILISLYCFAAIPLKFAKEKGLVKTQSQVYGYLLFGGLFTFIALIYVLIAEEKNHE
jgi:pilus assembly protein TadC